MIEITLTAGAAIRITDAQSVAHDEDVVADATRQGVSTGSTIEGVITGQAKQELDPPPVITSDPLMTLMLA